jgi:hypothetical protein
MELGRIEVQCLGKKLARSHLDKEAGVMVHTCNPRYMGGIGRRTVV